MQTDVDTGLVSAARAGDPAALDELVALHLPLVYNIVGRALDRGFGDVDDVVQDTMLNVVRGLPELRAPEAFRSWLVAVAMNQVRRHYGRRQSSEPLDAAAELADPAADFADLTIWELDLTGQRREVARATAWLDPDDRDLLALWWLVEVGELTRPELVAGLGVDPHHAAVRVSRMKNTLEVARCVVRALDTVPLCPGMADIAAVWHGRPEPLWRKRFARHVRDCQYCAGTSYDLIPAERLLARLSLVPLPIGLAARVRSALRPRGSSPTPHRRISKGGGSSRVARVPVKLTAVAGTAAIVGTAAVLMGAGHGASPAAGAAHQGLVPSGGPGTTAAATVAVSASPSTAADAAVDPSSTTALRTSATTKATMKPMTSPSPARTTTTTASGVVSGTAEQQVLETINNARAAQGLPPLTLSSGLNKSAAAHTQVMMSGCGLSHQCPGEAGLGDRETAAGVSWTSAGENIGEGGPVSSSESAIAQMAVGLTNSMLAEKPPNDGHRRNILSSSFTHIGISVVRDSSGTVWMTQDFSN